MKLERLTSNQSCTATRGNVVRGQHPAHDEIFSPPNYALDPVAVAVPLLELERWIVVRGHRPAPWVSADENR
jgi:hypothetical protein